jgi:hypothetical protein
MRWSFLVVATFAVGCASTGFHDGRTSLRKEEQGYLVARKGAPKAVFERFWQSAHPPSVALVQWQEEKSWACPEAPADLLQAIRDELGRLNQRSRAGENISIAVTVYRFEKAGTWSKPTAYYELVARNQKGQVIWAADDTVEAQDELARSLVESPSAIIGREVLRKVRQQLGI